MTRWEGRSLGWLIQTGDCFANNPARSCYRGPGGVSDDVAFLLLDQLPEGVAPVILGSALHNEDHRHRPACRAAQDDRRGSQLGCQKQNEDHLKTLMRLYS